MVRKKKTKKSIFRGEILNKPKAKIPSIDPKKFLFLDSSERSVKIK